MRKKVQEAIAKIKLTLPCLLPLMLIAMLAFLVSCTGQAVTTGPEPTAPSYTDLTTEEANDMISQQEVVVLDVRTQEEYNSVHIPDALLIPLSELESRLDELSTTDNILVYCRSGHRSEEAATILVTNEFIHIYNMAGGILQWQAQGFPVYTEQAPTTSLEPTTPSYTDVTPEEAYEMISQQEIVVLDVRTQEEYNSGHIPDALLIPLSELESRLDELNPSDRILVYCHSGCRSKRAAATLVDNDFIHVYNMLGGILQWRAKGFPAVPLTYTDVSPEEAREMIRQQQVVVVDLRTQENYNSGYIPDALLIPLSKFELRLRELNTTDRILVYHSCVSYSRKASQILINNGFLYVYHLGGGIYQWQAQGFPVCTEQTPTTSPESYTDVTPEEAREMIRQQQVVVVDLRTQENYNSGHIPDALLIPLPKFELRLRELNTTDRILVYHSCVSCSRKAAQILINNGFLYVYNLKGGIYQWQALDFPITRETEGLPCCP